MNQKIDDMIEEYSTELDGLLDRVDTGVIDLAGMSIAQHEELTNEMDKYETLIDLWVDIYDIRRQYKKSPYNGV